MPVTDKKVPEDDGKASDNQDEEMPEVVDSNRSQMRFTILAKDALQMNKKGP
jgi:hypothetical protein